MFITTMSAVFIGSGYIIISMYYFGTGGAGKKIYRTCVAHHTNSAPHTIHSRTRRTASDATCRCIFAQVSKYCSALGAMQLSAGTGTWRITSC